MFGLERGLSQLNMPSEFLGDELKKSKDEKTEQGSLLGNPILGIPALEKASQVDPETLHPLVLAYLGDAVYELYIRYGLVTRGFTRVSQLHQEATRLVRATCQAQYLHEIEEVLTDEEKRIMKRGRNAKSGHVPRNVEAVDYRWSTGFESLIGYLYLKQRFKRLNDILSRLPWPEGITGR